MKSIRNIFVAAALAVAVLALTVPNAQAQKAGQYSVISSNTIAGTSTNTALASTQTVSEFDNVGIHITAIPQTPGAGNFVLLGYKSGDGGVSFESTPSIVIGASLSAGTNIVFTNVAISGVSHIQFVPGNTASGYVTNTVKVTLKSPKYGARQASQ